MCNGCMCRRFTMESVAKFLDNHNNTVRMLYNVTDPYEKPKEETVGTNLDVYLRHWDED